MELSLNPGSEADDDEWMLKGSTIILLGRSKLEGIVWVVLVIVFWKLLSCSKKVAAGEMNAFSLLL